MGLASCSWYLIPTSFRAGAKSPARSFEWELRPARGACRRAASSLRTTVLCPTLEPSTSNSPRLLSWKRALRVAPTYSIRRIWPREWKTLAISGKIRGQVGLKSLSVGEKARRYYQ